MTATATGLGSERPRPRVPGPTGVPVGPGALVDAASTLLVLAGVVLASLPWARAYQGHVTAWATTAAAAGSVAVSTSCRRLRLAAPVAVAVAASVLGLALTALVLCGPHPAAVGHALVQGPADLVSETLPLRGGLAPATLPATVTWVAAAVAAELDGRLRRSGAALAVPVLTLAGVWTLTSAAGPLGGADPAAVLGVAVGGAALRQRALRPRRLGVGNPTPGPGRHRSRGWVGPTGIAATCAGLALAAAVAVPTALPSHHAPGLARSVPTVGGTLIDPVDETALLRDNAGPHPAPVLQVTLDTPSSGYLATSVVDGYDGGSWSFSARFVPTGGRVPPAPDGTGAGVGAARTVADVELSGVAPAGPLPVPDRATEVSGVTVDADPLTGMVVPAAAIAGKGVRYRVTSSAPSATVAGMTGADALATSPAAALPAGTAPDIGAVVRSLATATGDRPAATVRFVQEVDAVFARLDRQAAPGATAGPGGTSLAQVIDATTGVRVGSPEQFATMVALVARSLGVPARVATGYRVPAAARSAAGTVAAGTYTLSDADAWTWAEVPVPGVGWVVVDATPSITSASSPPPPVQVSATPPPSPTTPQVALPAAGLHGGHALAPSVALHLRAPARRSSGAATVEGVAVALGVAVLLGLATPALRRSSRRRARAGGGPRTMAAGAWLEVLDSLERAGLAMPASATVEEVTEAACASFGSSLRPSLASVGTVAERAVFDPTGPGPDDAGRAWDQRGVVARQVAATLDRRQRVVAMCRVGSAPRRPHK